MTAIEVADKSGFVLPKRRPSRSPLPTVEAEHSLYGVRQSCRQPSPQPATAGAITTRLLGAWLLRGDRGTTGFSIGPSGALDAIIVNDGRRGPARPLDPGAATRLSMPRQSI